MEIEESSLDVVVLGTGLAQSIVAAAAARVGKKVLHLDTNDYYGETWATHTLDGLQRVLAATSDNDNPADAAPWAADGRVPVHTRSGALSGVSGPFWFATSEGTKEEGEGTQEEGEGTQEDAEAPVVITRAAIEQQARRYNLDVRDKWMFCRGPVIDLLLQSGVNRYLEFKLLERTRMLDDGTLHAVPCSRSDVFTSTLITPIAKRRLMKFMALCLPPDPKQDAPARPTVDLEGKTFAELLASYKLPPLLQRFVTYAIALLPDEHDVTARDGVADVDRYLGSLGRYGNSPVLWPLYGVGEFPQAFCRLAAVFGAMYILRHGPTAITMREGRCVGVVHSTADDAAAQGEDAAEQELECAWLVTSARYVPALCRAVPAARVSRAVCITDARVGAGAELEMLVLPPHTVGNAHSIRVCQYDATCDVCPKGQYVVHLTCTASGASAEADLRPAVEHLFRMGDGGADAARPRALWTVFFSQDTLVPCDDAPANVLVCSEPDGSIHAQAVFAEARALFTRMFPDDEFLPTPDDPNDQDEEVLAILQEEEAQEEAATVAESKEESEEEKEEVEEAEGKEEATVAVAVDAADGDASDSAQ